MKKRPAKNNDEPSHASPPAPVEGWSAGGSGDESPKPSPNPWARARTKKRGKDAPVFRGAPEAGTEKAEGGVRLQRVMADAGVGARRACEALIEKGHVSVNGTFVRVLPIFVDPSVDEIKVDGKLLQKPERHIYVMLNKPTKTITSVSDRDDLGNIDSYGETEGDGGRRTVMDLVDHPANVRLFPVGRLDYDTTGLVLMTNDGELANRLTHPRYGVHKTYEAVVKGDVAEDAIEELQEGIFLAERKEGRTTGAARTARVELEVLKRGREKTILRVMLKEGRNRQVRRMLAQVGYPVKKLTRVSMGPLELKGVAVGRWRELDGREIKALKRAAGL